MRSNEHGERLLSTIKVISEDLEGICNLLSEAQKRVMTMGEFIEDLQKELEADSEDGDNSIAENEVTIEFDVQNNLDVPSRNEVSYYGSPTGSGFECVNKLDSMESTKCLYVVEQFSASEAWFYPLKSKATRLINNSQDFLETVCKIDGDISTASEFEVETKGRLKLEEDKYWRVTEKCLIRCL